MIFCRRQTACYVQSTLYGAAALVVLSATSAEAVPTKPGLEFTMPANRMHFTLPEGKMHLTMPEGRMHYTMPKDN